MPIELIEGGRPRFAVSVGGATRGTALSRILSLRGSPGWIVGTAVQEWHFDGVLERDGIVYLVGPPARGATLKEVLEQDAGTALPKIGQLAHALLDLSRSPAGWFALQSDSVIFTEDGAVLVLPPAIDRELRDLRPFEDKRETYEGLTHPDLKAEARTVFFLAAALYRLLTGQFPFSGADAEELHSQARSLEVQPPAVHVPGLDPEVSEVVLAGLQRGRRGAVTLAQLADALDRWQARPLRRPPSDEERRSAEVESAARTAAAERSFRRRRFWQKNWRVAAVTAAVVIVLGSLAGTMLKNSPPTKSVK